MGPRPPDMPATRPSAAAAEEGVKAPDETEGPVINTQIPYVITVDQDQIIHC